MATEYRGPIVVIRSDEWDALKAHLLILPRAELEPLRKRLDAAIARRDTEKVKSQSPTR